MALREYEVGQPYLPGRTRWPAGADYNWRAGQHELRLFFSRLGDREVRDVRTREAEFGLYVEQPLIVLLYRFGASIPWSDAPYSIWLVPADQRALPDPVGEGAETRDLLTTFLVDADSGILRAIRVVSLSPAFTFALRLAALYRRYPSSQALLKAATSRTKGGA